MNAPDTDKQLNDLFKANAPFVDEDGLRRRVAVKARLKSRSRPKARAARTVLVTCTGFVVLAAVGYGGYAALRHSSSPSVLVLTDAPAQETDSTAAATSSTSSPATTDSQDMAKRVTGTEARAMGATDKLAGYTTVWTDVTDRQANVKVATQYAGGVLLAPGQEYDLDQIIGPRTTARGFKLARGTVGPDMVEDVSGGALTQVATTLYNAVLHAGLQIDERHNNAFYVTHYPRGRDAALTAGGKDLRFTNDTEHYLWIEGTSDGVTTAFTIWGTNDGRKVDISRGEFYDIQPATEQTESDPHMKTGVTTVLQAGQTGQSIKVTRTVTRDGTVIHNDVFVSVYPMIPRTIAVGTSK